MLFSQENYEKVILLTDAQRIYSQWRNLMEKSLKKKKNT
jgi:hypothetical protein